jgi:hypothetical protein
VKASQKTVSGLPILNEEYNLKMVEIGVVSIKLGGGRVDLRNNQTIQLNI